MTEKRWTRGDWSFHVRPGVEHEADLTISHAGVVMMDVSGSAEFCRTMIRATNYDHPAPDQYRCRVVELPRTYGECLGSCLDSRGS